MKHQFGTVLTVVGLLASTPALAQKAKDTLRVPLSEPIAGLTIYLNSNVEMEYSVNAVQDTLIVFDEKENKFAPLLAKSWKRIDDRTVEFDLRDDVTWHDGEKFDSADVKNTLEWATDPEVKLRNKQYYDWIEKVDTLGPHKLRVITRTPTPWYEAQLAVKFHIQPEHLFAKLPPNDKMSFARKPIGTGMYRATDVTDAKGIYLARNDA
ncbi:MAG: transporter substrate-binding protein, partial [Rhodospirillales bacterium]|nr:transporter substrate-binding protein [Rhodospirillales bacterium]